MVSALVLAAHPWVKVLMPCPRLFAEPCLGKALVFHRGDPAVVAVGGVMAGVDIQICTDDAGGLSVEATVERAERRFDRTTHIVGRVHGAV